MNDWKCEVSLANGSWELSCSLGRCSEAKQPELEQLRYIRVRRVEKRRQERVGRVWSCIMYLSKDRTEALAKRHLIGKMSNNMSKIINKKSRRERAERIFPIFGNDNSMLTILVLYWILIFPSFLNF